MSNTFDGDVRVRGRLSADALDAPSLVIGDSNFSSGSPLAVEKQEHQYVRTGSQAHGSAAAAERRVIHVAHGEGNVEDFLAGIVVQAAGAASVTVDLLKNGVSVLNAAITLTSANIPYQKVVGTFNPSPSTYAVGDVFEVVVTAVAGGGTLPQGLFWKALFREAVGA